MKILLLGLVLVTTSLGSHRVPPFNLEAFRCHLDNIYHESRGLNDEETEAIIAVVDNRKQALKKTDCEVIYQPYQFSWTAQRRIVREKELYAALGMRLATRFGRGEAQRGRDGGRHVTGNVVHLPKEFLSATHYHAVGVNPGWTKKLVRIGRIRNHIFYRNEAWTKRAMSAS